MSGLPTIRSRFEEAIFSINNTCWEDAPDCPSEFIMTFSVKKRDDCIWFKHLPHELQRVLNALGAAESVSVILNGRETVWCRMRSGPGGPPTTGIRPLRGTEVWKAIARGNEFTIA